MSHVFISYSHDDIEYRDRLIDALQEANFGDEDIWYDDHIEEGDSWRDEIQFAIDDAFAVVVIVSENSMDSHYCTYEWSYAMGIGIPVLPALFDDVSATKVHAPLAKNQWTECVSQIPSSFVDRIAELKRIPPDIAYLKEIIFEITCPVYDRFLILVYIVKYSEVGWNYYTQKMFQYSLTKAKEYSTEMKDIILNFASAFSKKMKRQCRDILIANSSLESIGYAVSLLNQSSQNEYYSEQYLLNKKDVLIEVFLEDWIDVYERFDFPRHNVLGVLREFEQGYKSEKQEANMGKSILNQYLEELFPFLDEIDILDLTQEIDTRPKTIINIRSYAVDLESAKITA